MPYGLDIVHFTETHANSQKMKSSKIEIVKKTKCKSSKIVNRQNIFMHSFNMQPNQVLLMQPNQVPNPTPTQFRLWFLM